MKAEQKRLEVNPLVAKLLESAEGEPITSLEGYIGPSEEAKIRLYTDLQLNEYIDLPEEAVLHAEEPDQAEGRVRLWLRADARVQIISTRTTSAQAARLSIGGIGSGPSLGGGFFPFPLPSYDCLLKCQERYEYCLRTNPVLEKDPQVCDRIWAACLAQCMREPGGVVVF